MDFHAAFSYGLLNPTEMVILAIAAPILLGVYFGLKAW